MTMHQSQTLLEKIRLGCVPEHFSSPVYQALQSSLFTPHGLDLELISCPGGTGEMISKLNSNDLDIAIALTEGLVSHLSNTPDPKFKIIGTYVTSPLTWSIATSPHPDSKFAKTPKETPGPEGWADLKDAKIGISRYGSGSHIIPYVLADKMGWLSTTTRHKPPFEFVVLNNINGLVEGIQTGKADAFLWERIMTKPYYDNNTLHHLSNITPPWPAFMFAASTRVLAEPGLIDTMLNILSQSAKEFMADRDASITYVCNQFHLPEPDVKTWFEDVIYPDDVREISKKVLEDCVGVLKKAGVITGEAKEMEVEQLVEKMVDRNVGILLDDEAGVE